MEWDFYIKANEILSRYKNNEPGAAEELIDQFSGFLNKFSNIINKSIVDLSNKSTRAFINMFVKNPNFKGRMHQISHSKIGMEVVGGAVSLITQIFTARFEEEEINNIIIMTFLACAKKYEPIDDNPRFHLYLTACFHFRLYENLMLDVIDDALNLAMTKDEYISIEEIESEYPTYDKYELNEVANSRVNKLRTESDILVDDNWVIGLTTDLLKGLTIFERKLLKMKYVDKYSDAMIAEEIGTSAKYVNQKKLALLSQIEQQLLDDKLLKG